MEYQSTAAGWGGVGVWTHVDGLIWFQGFIQRALGRATEHLMFERSEMRDRQVVANRLKQHVADANQLPILIFPEGESHSIELPYFDSFIDAGFVIF